MKIGFTRKVKKINSILSSTILSISFSLMGCSDNSQPNGTPALFDTKIEAEKAAKDFNCTGAHRMGERWMPCKSHTIHKKGSNHDTHNGNHHH